jgi:hypothetical protein
MWFARLCLVANRSLYCRSESQRAGTENLLSGNESHWLRRIVIRTALPFGVCGSFVPPGMRLLEFFPEKFDDQITDERGYCGNLKIRGGENILEGPTQAVFPSHARPFKFSHQQVGVKEKEDKPDLDGRSSDVFLHDTAGFYGAP